MDQIDINLFDANNVEQVFDALFDKYEISDAVLAKTADHLMQAKEYRKAATLLYAVIRNQQGNAWVYGLLPLALQADNASPRELERALLSTAPYLTSPLERMLLAKSLQDVGANRRALQIYTEVCEMQPGFPDPYRFGIRLAENLNDAKSLQRIILALAAQSWAGDDMAKLWQQRGNTIANGLIEKMRAENRLDEAKKFETDLRQATQRDCVVIFEYVGDSEVDISVKEPAQTICWFANPQTLSGGMLGPQNKGTGVTANVKRGNYVCPYAFSGMYEVLVERVWGKVTGDRVKVTVYTHLGTDKAVKEEKFITLDANGMAVVKFELTEGRNTGSIKEVEAAALVQEAERIRVADILAKNTKQQKPTEQTGINRTVVASGGTAYTDTSSLQQKNYAKISPANSFRTVTNVTVYEMKRK